MRRTVALASVLLTSWIYSGQAGGIPWGDPWPKGRFHPYHVNLSQINSLPGNPDHPAWHVMYGVQTWTRDTPAHVAFDYVGDTSITWADWDPAVDTSCQHRINVIGSFDHETFQIRGSVGFKTCGGERYWFVKLNSFPAVQWRTVFTDFGWQVRNTVAHEIGHVLGLGHPNITDSVMVRPDPKSSRRDHRILFKDAYAAAEVMGVREVELQRRYVRASPSVWSQSTPLNHGARLWGASNGMEDRPNAACEYHFATRADVWADNTLAPSGSPPHPNSQAIWSSVSKAVFGNPDYSDRFADFGSWRRPDAAYYRDRDIRTNEESEEDGGDGGEAGGGGEPAQERHRVAVLFVEPWTNRIVLATDAVGVSEDPAQCPDFLSNRVYEEDGSRATIHGQPRTKQYKNGFHAVYGWNGRTLPDGSYAPKSMVNLSTIDEPTLTWDPASERMIIAYTHESRDCYINQWYADPRQSKCLEMDFIDGSVRSLVDGEVVLAVSTDPYLLSFPFRLFPVRPFGSPSGMTLTTSGPAVACGPSDKPYFDFNCLLAYTTKAAVPRLMLRSFRVGVLGGITTAAEVNTGHVTFDSPEVAFDGSQFVVVFRPLSEDSWSEVSNPVHNHTGVLRVTVPPVSGAIGVAPVIYINNRLTGPPGIGSHHATGAVEIYSSAL